MDNILETRADLKKHKRSLQYVFWIHFFMFFLVFFAAMTSGSTALLADSLDFIGDAASYLLSIYVMTRGPVVRAFASMGKALVMISFCIPMLVHALSNLSSSTPPNYEIMNLMGFLGIIAHVICLNILLNFRHGDSNLLSVWICTINDLLCNIVIVITSFLVAKTGSVVPDVVGAVIIVGIALYGAFLIFHRATKELKEHKRNLVLNNQ